MTAVGGTGGGGRIRARSDLIRDIVVIVLIAASCPGAMLGGALLNCADEGFGYDCALEGVTFSPFLLLGAGVVAGLIVRGWRGYAITLIGVVLGMTAILIVSFIEGNLVLIGPIEGIIATVWFGLPVTIGYGIGRVIARVVRRGAA